MSYLTVGDTYDFYVTAINLAGEGPASNVAQATSYVPPPAAPTGLTASANNDSSILLSWTAPAPGLYYWIWYHDENASGITLYTRSKDPVTGTSIRLFYLTVGHTYDFFVTAVNAGGAGPHSNVASATPVVPDGGASASVASNWWNTTYLEEPYP